MSIWTRILGKPDKAETIFARIQASIARREKQREYARKLEDDRRVREAMVGRPYAKRRAAQKAVRG